jgi:hypothetical protein
VNSVRDVDKQKSTLPLQDDGQVAVGPIRKLWNKVTGGVRDGDWCPPCRASIALDSLARGRIVGASSAAFGRGSKYKVRRRNI